MGHDILTGIAISIVGAASLALLARRVHQPLILGYILAGILLGPHLGLGVIRDEESIELISEIGLIFLLFIIGLEISVPRLLQAGRTITVTGLLQFPICVALAWAAFGLATQASGGQFDRLYLAVALGLSSTMIVVKLLSDKYELGTFAGRVTVGILVFQDLWAITFLALQPKLQNLRPGPMLRSFALGAVLVGAAALLSRYVLPGLFRAIAKSPELVLLTAIGWCFLVSLVAALTGLSKEMGALIAGMVIAAFPYGSEVIARLAGVRDFFITLFFVALGLKVPTPSMELLVFALVATAFVALSRFAALAPLFMLLRVDTRTASVVAINLSQISEFSLVIITLGAGYGHVSHELTSLVLYTLLFSAVVSTYGIVLNYPLASRLTQVLSRIGVPGWRGPTTETEPPSADVHDLFLLGVSREGLALLQHLEREHPQMKDRIVAIDFNPETLELLQADGVECHYGDISNAEALRHAGIERAALVVSMVSDWFLRGTDNLRLLRQVRRLAAGAHVVVTADTLFAAERLYAEGADYVLIPPALAAAHLCGLLRDASPEALAEARVRQTAELFAQEPNRQAESP